ncbi:MAG: DUF4230 domain-containing protein [Methylacidiphilales bacterium]|nr:DUF4230 domain-containing protein [Candidatus Methylacidiphilales bacterium]MDW8350179.1 DUF4230 domain-containing protein [Verrucomicrobiae bacterium]
MKTSIRFLLASILIGITIIGGGYWIIQRLWQRTRDIATQQAQAFISAGERAAARAKRLLTDFFQVTPALIVNHKEEPFNSPRSIAEFSVVDRINEATHSWEHTWMGSTKRITVSGLYNAKYGFDLTEPFLIEYNETDESLSAAMPPAKLLSVEIIGELTFKSDSGIINWVNDEDRQNAINGFLARIREQAEANTELKRMAEEQVILRLRELAQMNGQKIDFKIKQTDKGS